MFKIIIHKIHSPHPWQANSIFFQLVYIPQIVQLLTWFWKYLTACIIVVSQITHGERRTDVTFGFDILQDTQCLRLLSIRNEQQANPPQNQVQQWQSKDSPHIVLHCGGSPYISLFHDASVIFLAKSQSADQEKKSPPGRLCFAFPLRLYIRIESSPSPFDKFSTQISVLAGSLGCFLTVFVAYRYSVLLMFFLVVIQSIKCNYIVPDILQNFVFCNTTCQLDSNVLVKQQTSVDEQTLFPDQCGPCYM